MKKKKRKYANVIMLLLIIFVLFFIVFQDKNLVMNAAELVDSYSINQKTADKKYLNKEIELSGEVKSFFQFEDEKSLLELRTANDKLKLYCILINKETEQNASSLTAGTTVKVFGKCLGIKDYKFTRSIYIKAEQIK